MRRKAHLSGILLLESRDLSLKREDPGLIWSCPPPPPRTTNSQGQFSRLSPSPHEEQREKRGEGGGVPLLELEEGFPTVKTLLISSTLSSSLLQTLSTSFLSSSNPIIVPAFDPVPCCDPSPALASTLPVGGGKEDESVASCRSSACECVASLSTVRRSDIFSNWSSSGVFDLFSSNPNPARRVESVNSNSDGEGQ